MINIIIADDHEIVVEGLISLIKPEDGIRIVGEANNGKDVIPLLEKNRVDIAVLDISMPIMDGIELTNYIKKYFPKVKILILTMHDDPRFIRRTIEVGVHGYILKNKGKEEFVTAIKTIYFGEDYFGKKVTKTLISGHRSKFIEGEIILTKKEKEILKLIAKGYSTPEIAKQLCRANTTIDSHRRNLIEKTGVKNSKALIRFAFENGYE
ncbi:response regulator transcription factor [Flavivirga aquimarina]|uniref:Response regulator transcription factor n=1 Tax=Flavivirga aquimarina TaxID=2027862 RepID=A0ABT8W6Z2_9FLAO|nr:response regulator transcription factor [Flavivirga aquimarina]MDO5968866.1 response regulator transcription factor [Flavivirga aquimarina]